MKKVRRKDRGLRESEAQAILAAGEYGVLSTVGVDGQPYGVPLNYVYQNNCIYFHCALVGHKMENIKKHPRVAFCVVGPTHILPAELSTVYESAMAFGEAAEIEGDEKQDALIWLLEKYAPEFMEDGRKAVAEKFQATAVIKISIDYISGKARRP